MPSHLGGQDDDGDEEHEKLSSSLTPLASYERIMGKGETTSNTALNFRATSSSSTRSHAEKEEEEKIATEALSNRLALFRKWLKEDAGVEVHSAVCIVNGEATDRTKNAPVMVLEKPPGMPGAAGDSSNKAGQRVGAIDWSGEQALYDRTMGCQVRVVRDVQEGQVIITMPRHAMVTPDLVASSDAGRAILACCKAPKGVKKGEKGFWDAFENTTICESVFSKKLAGNTGTQLLAKILEERERAETVLEKCLEEQKNQSSFSLAVHSFVEKGTISTRAPLLAFLIHQRFSPTMKPLLESENIDLLRVVRETHSGGMDDNLDLEEFPLYEDTLEAEDSTGLEDKPAGENQSALLFFQRVSKPPGVPESFAPYARTLPSIVSIPLCWKQSELEMLASSLPGLALLQDISATTFQLASEFTALLESGLLQRIPDVFPEGLLTWDRWVWAAAIVASRALPVTCYIDKGLKDATEFEPSDPLEFQSPADIWNELGVMVPLLDMLNHEIEAHQVTWKPCVPTLVDAGDSVIKVEEPSSPSPDELEKGKEIEKDENAHPPRAIVHKKVKKDSELFCCYSTSANQSLILQYGFAQMANPADEVRIGWGLMDAVGHLDPPQDYSSLLDDESLRKFLIFEANGQEDVDKWWTPDRMKLLEKEAFSESEEGFMSKLEDGKKFTALAYADGAFHPILLAALVVATMPKIELQKHLSSKQSTVSLSKRHQQVFRSYLAFFYARKLEKLLQNISEGLNERFGVNNLWTKATKGSLNYNCTDGDYMSWQSFFDAHAFRSTMEVEKHYYAMGPDSCVLFLYDGQLRALQYSLDAVCSKEKFNDNLLRQLKDLGFSLAEDKDETESKSNGQSAEKKSPKNKKRSKQKNATTVSTSTAGEKPPALKLHVGNLNFATTPADMYDYFSSIYGKDNVLECHIPIERETGRSRGFGFVTMPESIANKVLDSGKKHELGGRVVKVARSNSAGTSSSGRAKPGVVASSDRCPNCGYRPKYCSCSRGPPPPPHPLPGPGFINGDMGPRRGMSPRGIPPILARNMNMPPDPRFYDPYGPRPGDYPMWDGPPPDYYYDRGDDRYRDRYGHGEYERDPHYLGPRYDDVPSRSYDRDNDRHHRRGSRGHSTSADSRNSNRRYVTDDPAKSSSRREDALGDGKGGGRKHSRSRSRSYSRSRSNSRSPSRERSRKKKSKKRAKSRSRSPSVSKGK